MAKIQKNSNYVEMLENLVETDEKYSALVEQKENWFIRNPNDTRLINHALKKRMQGRFAFSIDKDIRVVYEWLGHNTARFLAIGTHEQVYGRPKDSSQIK